MKRLRCGLAAHPAAAAHALSDADEQHRGDHRDDEAKDIQLEDAPGTHEAGDRSANHRPGKSQQQGREQAEVLFAGLDEPCQRADDESSDDKSDHDNNPFCVVTPVAAGVGVSW